MNKTRLNLLIKYSVQEQIHFNGNVFGNKCCRCNEGSLYFQVIISSQIMFEGRMYSFLLFFLFVFFFFCCCFFFFGPSLRFQEIWDYFSNYTSMTTIVIYKETMSF